MLPRLVFEEVYFYFNIRCQVFVLQRGALTIHNVNDLQCYKFSLQESKFNKSGKLGICFFQNTSFDNTASLGSKYNGSL
jgi:hypothetical protein